MLSTKPGEVFVLFKIFLVTISLTFGYIRLLASVISKPKAKIALFKVIPYFLLGFSKDISTPMHIFRKYILVENMTYQSKTVLLFQEAKNNTAARKAFFNQKRKKGYQAMNDQDWDEVVDSADDGEVPKDFVKNMPAGKMKEK